MARDPIHTGHNVDTMQQAAARYSATVAQSNEQTQSLFDRYYARKRAEQQDALELEKHQLNKERQEEAIKSEAVQRQNAMLQGEMAKKNLASYEENQALNKQKVLSDIKQSQAAAGLNAANTKAINQSVEEKEDLKRFKEIPYFKAEKPQENFTETFQNAQRQKDAKFNAFLARNFNQNFNQTPHLRN